MRESLPVTCAIVVASMVFVAPASADLTGSTVTLDSFYPNLASNIGSWGPAVVANPGVEFASIFSGAWSSDVAAYTVRLDQLANGNALGSASFSGFVYTFTGLANPISSVTLDGSSTLTPTNLYSTGNQIFVDYAGAGIVNASFSLINVTFVPSPGAVAVLGLGVLGLGRRRRG